MRFARVFGDHAVLQRDRSAPVWGWTEPERLVTVRLEAADGVMAEAVTRADESGRFFLYLPPQSAGGPYVLAGSAYDDGGAEAATAVSRDVWFGEVWLASGQSNMHMNVDATGERPWEEAPPPAGVRMFTVSPDASVGHGRNVDADWEVATAATIPYFSAAAYFFAAKLHRELGVPVGILHASWGGTYAEAWISRAALAQNPDMTARLQRYALDVHRLEAWEKRKAEIGKTADEIRQTLFRSRCSPDPGNVGVDDGWASPDFDDSAWPSMTLPGAWTRQGQDTNGVFWFRRTVTVAPSDAGRDLVLHLGAVDKTDISYWNGEEIGRTGAGFDESHWNRPRRYVVPGSLVKAGENVVAVRAYSFAYDGGLIGPRIGAAPGGDEGRMIDLAGPWRFRIEHDFGRITAQGAAEGPGNPNTPHILFDRMIRPLIPYALRGAIWYQGESNSDNAACYRRLMVDLARDWRYRWEQGGCPENWPFVQVQLAGFRSAKDYDPAANWTYLREAQFLAAHEPGIGMVSALDLGDAVDIHPVRKREVGERLAGWALAKTYRRPGHAAHGPHYAGMTVESGRIRLRFIGVEGGLRSRDGKPLATFYVAGMDRRFMPATAAVDGGDVVVSSPEVPEPAAVRYAWSDNPEAANLVNDAGLPASSFRTDTW